MDAASVPLLAALRSAADRPAWLVRVVSLKGFGLRDGSDGLVARRSPDGLALEGRLLGGLADAAVSEALADASEGRALLRVPVTDAAADAAGMVCGGTARLLASPVDDLPEGTDDLLATATPFVVVARADAEGADTVVTRKDILGASAGAELDEAVVEAARALLAEGSSGSTVVEVAGTEWLLAALVPATRALVVGSGPMADAIAAQGALLGWDVAIDESVDLGVDFLGGAGPADALIILSHDRSVDIPLLEAALRSSIGYIGAMGSRGTQTARRTRLTDLGFDDADLARIHGPVGLDLGSRTPAETAVAITAEFLANRSGRTPASLAAGAGPINR